MDRDDLVNAVADEIYRLRVANRNVTSRALARAALAIIEPAVREELLSSTCPFDRVANNLEPEDPCPVCGDLGTFTDDAPPSRCITGHTRVKP